MIFVGGWALSCPCVLYLVLIRYQIRTGHDNLPGGHSGLVVLIALPLLAGSWWARAPWPRRSPVLGKFNFDGGLRLTPEFAALLAGW